MGFWVLDQKDEANALKINAWNWRPTLVMLEQFQILDAEQLERMSFNGGNGNATVEQARVIAQKLKIMLEPLGPGDRFLLDRSTTTEPDDFVFHQEDLGKNYGASREWLEQFMNFCEGCQGFRVI
jgi:hypothetical protein